MTNRIILVCAASKLERDRQLHAAKADGAQLDAANSRAVFPSLGIELRFEILARNTDADRLRGLELAGVLNIRAVDLSRDGERIRDMIYSRLRP